MTRHGPHPVLAEAAEGRLPEWTVATPRRREHMGRVASLMGSWSSALELPEPDRVRWTAVGWLHDALRDAPAARLREELPDRFQRLPDPLLHGPAAAERLRGEGVEDASVLLAVAYHTAGHPEMDRLGRALYAADFLEPGRSFLPEWRAELRARMPEDERRVTLDVARARIGRLLRRSLPMPAETAEFWSMLLDSPGGPEADGA